jgi:hypothetical protein
MSKASPGAPLANARLCQQRNLGVCQVRRRNSPDHLIEGRRSASTITIALAAAKMATNKMSPWANARPQPKAESAASATSSRRTGSVHGAFISQVWGVPFVSEVACQPLPPFSQRVMTRSASTRMRAFRGAVAIAQPADLDPHFAAYRSRPSCRASQSKPISCPLAAYGCTRSGTMAFGSSPARRAHRSSQTSLRRAPRP